MMSTITCTSQLQVVFSTIELKHSHLCQSRSRPKLDSQKLMLCLLQVWDILTKLEWKLIISLNHKLNITYSLEKLVFHLPPLFRKLRFCMVLPKVSRTLLKQVNSKLSTAKLLTWEHHQIANIKQSEINFWTQLKLVKMNRLKLINKLQWLMKRVRNILLILLNNVEELKLKLKPLKVWLTSKITGLIMLKTMMTLEKLSVNS